MLAFVCAWLAWALVSWGISQLIQASGLGGSDRLLGAVFGLVRGLLAALVIFVLARDTVERQRLTVCFLLSLGAAMFWSGFEQAGSALNLFAPKSARTTQRYVVDARLRF